MECNPNEPIDTVCSDRLGQTIYFGLTKREHMAIEFTKAILTAGNSLKPNTSNETICIAGITLADELIKQLNQTKTT